MAWPGSDAGGRGNWVWLFDFLVGTEHQVLGGLMDAQGTAFLWGVLPGTQEKEGPHRAGMGEWLRGMRLGGGVLSTCCRVLGYVPTTTLSLGLGAPGLWGRGEMVTLLCLLSRLQCGVGPGGCVTAPRPAPGTGEAQGNPGLWG